MIIGADALGILSELRTAPLTSNCECADERRRLVEILPVVVVGTIASLKHDGIFAVFQHHLHSVIIHLANLHQLLQNIEISMVHREVGLQVRVPSSGERAGTVERQWVSLNQRNDTSVLF